MSFSLGKLWGGEAKAADKAREGGAAAPGSAPFDALETRTLDAREAALFAALRALVKTAQEGSSYWRGALRGVDAEALKTREDLAALPILRKSDLIDLQEAEPPFGGLTAAEPGRAARLFLSPGPIAEPQFRTTGGEGTYWRMERALHAAGFRAGDRVANCFSYHLTPAGFMFDSALDALGCAVFPGGVGQTETQTRAFRLLGLNAYVGTPDFLRIILEKADEEGAPITGVKRACVTGGPLFPDLRSFYQQQGVHVRQCYGTAEIGLIAYETDRIEDGMALDENCLVEIVRISDGAAAAPGEVGEVVVTTFRAGYPLIRFATGDLSAMAPEVTDAAGRTAPRLKGWMGRADQTTKVRGMFVHPRQVAAALKAFPQITRSRLEVFSEDGKDGMRLLCETSAAPEPALLEKIAEAVRAECRLRAEVSFVAPGALPNDGKAIADLRS